MRTAVGGTPASSVTAPPWAAGGLARGFPSSLTVPSVVQSRWAHGSVAHPLIHPTDVNRALSPGLAQSRVLGPQQSGSQLSSCLQRARGRQDPPRVQPGC